MPIFEIMAPDFNGASDQTDDNVLWVQASSLSAVGKAIGNVPAIQPLDIPADQVDQRDIDFVLPGADDALRKKLQSLSSDPLMLLQHELLHEGVFDYCNQVCGGGECGSGPVCLYGIDAATHLPGRAIFDMD